MKIEGKGEVAPARIKCPIDHATLQYIIEQCDQMERFHRYAQSGTSWRRGFRKDAVLVGKLGEVGCASAINLKMGCVAGVDLRVRPAGDSGIDMAPCGCRVDVKSETRRRPELYVRSKRDDGAVIECNPDMIFCFMLVEHRECPEFVGWLMGRGVMACPNQPSPLPWAKHWNYVIPEYRLEPFRALVDLLEARRLARGTPALSRL